MALVKCPECGKEISDQCEACPHCGYPIKIQEKQNLEPQPVEVTGIKLNKFNKKKKIMLFSILGLVLLLIFGSITALTINKQNQEKAAKVAAAKVVNDYHDNLLLLELDMYTGASDSETLSNLTGKVWYNTIYQVPDDTTDKYTYNSNVGFNPDFNTSLQKLFADQSIKDTISKIESNQKTVSSLMKKMQNPPKEYQTSYETLSKLYVAYQGLTDLAVNPSGTLTTYSESKNTKANDFVTLYKTLDTQVPETNTASSSISSNK